MVWKKNFAPNFPIFRIRLAESHEEEEEFYFIFILFINTYFKLTLVILQLHSHEL